VGSYQRGQRHAVGHGAARLPRQVVDRQAGTAGGGDQPGDQLGRRAESAEVVVDQEAGAYPRGGLSGQYVRAVLPQRIEPGTDRPEVVGQPLAVPTEVVAGQVVPVEVAKLDYPR
jgi:hypothetical protein